MYCWTHYGHNVKVISYIYTELCLHTNIIVRAGDIVIPDKTSKQTHTFRSVVLNRRGSFEVEINVSNKREPVYIRNLSSANITWNIGCIELLNFDKANLGENITAVYFDMYIVFILNLNVDS